MANKVASKVSLNGKVLIDLTQDTTSDETVVSGVIYHKPDGTRSIGRAVTGKFIEVSTSEQMDYIIANANSASVGSCYKFIGENDSKYENNAIYVVTQS